jgi:hypothetical protein
MNADRDKRRSKSEPEGAADDERASAPAYTVGYRRPPIASRFSPGASGNPRGRPRGARGLSSLVTAALGERVAITENGRRKRITKLEAAVKQLVNRAAGGDARATQLILALVQSQEAKPTATEPDRQVEADTIVMAELARRLGGKS